MRLLARLRSASDGAALVEFAMIAPVLVMTIMGIFDMGYNMYTMSILQDTIQKAARDSTIEGAPGNVATIDKAVTDSVHSLMPTAALGFSRKSYTNFSDVSRPEDYTDLNGDGACDAGEPFEDANGNNRWDADRGTTGTGSARDAVLYEVTVTYPRLFPMAQLIGMPSTVTMSAATVLRNQPFTVQQITSATANCS